MVLLAKGSLIIGLTILCILSTVFAQTDKQPLVISATRIPVVGGVVHIYGQNFGSDASLLTVEVVDPASASSGNVVACTDVKIITPNRVISCRIDNSGTGKSKHIIVTVTKNTDGSSISISNSDDNVAFSREVPVLNTLTYSVETKSIQLAGDNFGTDVSKVVVTLEGDDYPVTDVTNTLITLRLLKKRREDDYTIPDTRFAYVTVDGQSNVANMTVAAASLVVEPETPEGVIEGKHGSGGSNKSTVAGLAAGGACVFVVVSILVAFFVMKRNKRDDLKQKAASGSDKSAGAPAPVALQFANISVIQERANSTRSLFNPIASDKKVTYAPDSPVVAATTATTEQEDAITTETVENNEVAYTYDESTAEEAAAVAAAVAANAVERSSSNVSHHSLEEIDLEEDNIYEKNVPQMSDSSFSDSSSDDESDNVDGSSSFDAEFSDASPKNSPAVGRRKQLQMSSEFPSGGLPSTRIEQKPSPPMLISSRASTGLPSSSLRRSMIPPNLNLDAGDSSDGSPLPSPRTISPGSKKGKKQKHVGMIRVPSSRIASSATIPKRTSAQENAFDSPHM